MKKIIIGLSLVVSLFASIESEVDAQRFSWKDGVLTDHFAQMQWQDNKDAKTITRNWQGAKDYCSKLTLGDQSDWRLPNFRELQYLGRGGVVRQFKNISHYGAKNDYWSSTPYSSFFARFVSFKWDGYYFKSDPYKDFKKGKRHVRCTRGRQYKSYHIWRKQIIKERKKALIKIK